MPDEEYMIVGFGRHPKNESWRRSEYWALEWDSTSPTHGIFAFNIYPTAHEAIRRAEELEVEDEVKGIAGVEYKVLPVSEWRTIIHSTEYFERLIEDGHSVMDAEELDERHTLEALKAAAVTETMADKD